MGKSLYDQYGRKVGELHDYSDDGCLIALGIIAIPIVILIFVINWISDTITGIFYPYIEVKALAKEASLSGKAARGSCLGSANDTRIARGSVELKTQNCILLSPGGKVTWHITTPRQDTYTALIKTDDRSIDESWAFNYHFIIDGTDWRVGSAPSTMGELSKGSHKVDLSISLDKYYKNKSDGQPLILPGIKLYAGRKN